MSKIRFTINDMSVILGKSPVTLRKWDRDGVVAFSRNTKGDRVATIEEIASITDTLYKKGRIDADRRASILVFVSATKEIEK